MKTGRVSQPITDADDATVLGMQRAPGVTQYIYLPITSSAPFSRNDSAATAQ